MLTWRQAKSISVVVATSLASGLAGAQTSTTTTAAANPGVTCVSYVLATGQQECSSSTPSVTLRTELGLGEGANYPAAKNIFVEVLGPDVGGNLDTVSVITQQALSGSGQAQIVKQNGTPVLIPAQSTSPSLTQKNAIVIVDLASGVPNLTVDASAQVSGDNAGSVVVVADSLQSLNVNVNGYNGQNGQNPLMTLAVDALSGNPTVPSGIAAGYVASRVADTAGALPLSFSTSDLDNYSANGLACRAGETAIGSASSYGAGTLFDPGAPYGIEITADAQEQTSRQYCQRLPEFTATQQCGAETEYSFQAACTVLPEGRSQRYYSPTTVTWQRNICTESFDAEVRNKIIRTAHIIINIPGLKSYEGEISQEADFYQTYNVLTPNTGQDGGPWACIPNPDTTPSCAAVGASGTWPSCTCPSGYNWGASAGLGGECSSPTVAAKCSDLGATGTYPNCSCAAGYTIGQQSGQKLQWYNPFWQQGYTLPSNATINVTQADPAVFNAYNNAVGWVDQSGLTDCSATNPCQDPPPDVSKNSSNQLINTSGNPQQGANVTYLSRPAYNSSGQVINNQSLFYFNNSGQLDVSGNPSYLPSFTVSAEEPNYLNNGSVTTYPVEGCASVVSSLGTQRFNFAAATTPQEKQHNNYNTYVQYYQSFDVASLGFSETDLMNAGLYGVITVTDCFAYESVDQVVAGQVGFGTWALVSNNSPLGVPSGSDQSNSVSAPPQVASVSDCVAPYTQPIGTETWLQYAQAGTCYIEDPRSPPDWIRQQVATLQNQANAAQGNASSVTYADVGPSDLDINGNPGMSSASWTMNTALLSPPAGAVAGQNSYLNPLQPTPPLNRNAEFTFPVSISQAVALALTTAQQQQFCVPVPSAPSDPNFIPTESITEGQVTLTLATVVPQFTIEQGSSVAIPSGSTSYVCLAGIRLDQFLANVSRPSCPFGTSTKMMMSKFSNQAGDPIWSTWEQQETSAAGQGGVDPLATPANYAVLSEYVETRYNDLPSEIYTAQTSAVSPAVSTDTSSSFTGQVFPPNYGFTSATPSGVSGVTVSLTSASPSDVFTYSQGGTTERANPGWLRQSSLTNQQGAYVTPDSMTPFTGTTLFERSTAWCNADGYVTAGNSLVTGFGAKGVLRDVPKRVFGFTLDDINAGLSHKYVGIEVIGTQSSLGFYATPAIYQGIPTVNAENVLNNLTAEAFRSSNYPFIGSRFAESCPVGSGQYYNQFTGFCHNPATPFQAAQMTVNRTLQDGKTLQPWSILLNKTNLLSPVAALDLAFYPNPNSTPLPPTPVTGPLTPVTPTQTNRYLPKDQDDMCFNNPSACTPLPASEIEDPNSIDVDQDINKYFQLGFLRPMAAMADNNVISSANFLNRPETISQMVLSPGFAADRSSQSSPSCSEGITILAVPVPLTPTTDPVTGEVYSISVDKNNYLPGVGPAQGESEWWGPVFITLTPSCDNNLNYTYTVAIRMMSDPSLTSGIPTVPLIHIAPSGGVIAVDATTGNLNLTFQNAANQPVWRMQDISETLAAGMSATTGYETLAAVDLSAPLIRNRASEWSAEGRTKGGRGYQSQILTQPTPPTQSTSVKPLSCTPANTDGGQWGFVGTQGSITLVSGSPNAVVASTSGLQASEVIACSGCGVPAGTTISSITNSTTLVMSQPSTATGSYLATFSTTTPITNGAPASSASEDCTNSSTTCALTAEELSLFTQPLANTLSLTVTRPAANQFTPWGFELPSTAAADPAYTSTQPFGSWTVQGNGAAPASVPDCSIYNGVNDAPDVYLPRAGLTDISDESQYTTVVDNLGAFEIMSPLNLTTPFIVVPDDSRPSAANPTASDNLSLRKSQSCVKWDSVTGTTCTTFYPTLGGPDNAPLIFGGTWQGVYVDTRTRTAQDCKTFAPTATGQLSAACQSGVMSLAATQAVNNGAGACAAGNPTEALCQPCSSGSSQLCAPYMQPAAGATTTLCSPGSCLFPENDQTYQVDASIPVSGNPGQNGTNSGNVTVFCRDCANVTFSALPGTAGQGTNPVASDRSPTLTCVSWNENPLSPIFSVRNLWSQPFIGGSAGQNGQPGLSGGTTQLFQDMTPEAVFQISNTGFWINPPQN